MSTKYIFQAFNLMGFFSDRSFSPKKANDGRRRINIKLEDLFDL